jgi:hypothetical protein
MVRVGACRANSSFNDNSVTTENLHRNLCNRPQIGQSDIVRRHPARLDVDAPRPDNAIRSTNLGHDLITPDGVDISNVSIGSGESASTISIEMSVRFHRIKYYAPMT